MGRTARAGKSGKSLLFLLPSELGFLRFLKIAKVPLNEYTFPLDKVANVQGQVSCFIRAVLYGANVWLQLEKLITKNYYLHQSAKDGFRSYIQAYASYSLKRIFNVHDLDLAKVAKAYGFSVPPAVNIPIGTSSKGAKRKNRNDEDVEVDAVDANGNDVQDDDEEEVVKRSERAPKQGRNERRRDVPTGKRGEKDFYREQKRPKAGVNGGTQWSR